MRRWGRIAVVLGLLLLAACAPTWEHGPSGPTPYDGKWLEWNQRYRWELEQKCLRAGHEVLTTDPVRCLGPDGEYTP